MFTDVVLNRQLFINNLNSTLNRNKLIYSCFKNAKTLYKETIDYSSFIEDFKFSTDENFSVTAVEHGIKIQNLNIENHSSIKSVGTEYRAIYLNKLCLNVDFTKIFTGTENYDGTYALFFYDTNKDLKENKICLIDKLNCISNCPINSNLVTFSCENKKLYSFDTREKTYAEIFKLEKNNFYSIQYHPYKDHLLLLTSGCEYGIYNFDLRNQKTVFNYYSPFIQKYKPMNARYNAKGDQIVASINFLNPLLYNSNEAYPFYEFDEFGYLQKTNSIRSCFCGPDDDFIVSCSNNFDLYIWEIPKNRISKKKENYTVKVKSAEFILNESTSCLNLEYNKQKSLLAYVKTRSINLWSPFSLYSKKDLLDHGKKKELNRYDCGRFMYNFISLCNIQARLGEEYLYENKIDEDSNFEIDLNIEFFKRCINRYHIEDKIGSSIFLENFEKFLKQNSKIPKNELYEKQVYFIHETRKIFETKLLFESFIFYLKNELLKLENSNIQMKFEDDYEKKISKNEQVIVSLINTLVSILKKNKVLYEQSFVLIKKIFEIPFHKEIFVDSLFSQDTEEINRLKNSLEKYKLKSIKIL